MGDYRQLIGYQKAFSLAMDIYHLSKQFPKEERYNLTDQLTRASRSVCANLVEAYKRRRFKNYFIAKLNDAETENSEIQVWLDFALACHYIKQPDHAEMSQKNSEVAKLILYMINYPDKFI